jgi:hypothetical protein
MMDTLLERIATALERQVTLAEDAQRDFRAAQARATEHVERQKAESAQMRRLVAEQAARNEARDRAAEAEAVRLAQRDEEQTALLREANERNADTAENFKVATGLAAPDYVPEGLVTVPPDEASDGE